MGVELEVWQLVAAMSPALAAVAWLVRQQGRISSHESLCAERYRHIYEHLEMAKEARERLERKLDDIGKRNPSPKVIDKLQSLILQMEEQLARGQHGT